MDLTSVHIIGDFSDENLVKSTYNKRANIYNCHFDYI